MIEYEDTGHISDKDASSQDYDSVLSDIKSAAEDENAARKEQGYPESHVVGWAQAPTYDAQKKTLIWARDIKFEGAEDDTLNYDVRTLGRSGVLSLNMVDVMPNLPMLRTAAARLGSTVQFDEGARYADFNESTDKTAEYGLAGLVAAGAGLAVAKKVGLIGLLILVLKKGLVVLLAAGAGAIAWVNKSSVEVATTMLKEPATPADQPELVSIPDDVRRPRQPLETPTSSPMRPRISSRLATGVQLL